MKVFFNTIFTMLLFVLLPITAFLLIQFFGEVSSFNEALLIAAYTAIITVPLLLLIVIVYFLKRLTRSKEEPAKLDTGEKVLLTEGLSEPTVRRLSVVERILSFIGYFF